MVPKQWQRTLAHLFYLQIDQKDVPSRVQSLRLPVSRWYLYRCDGPDQGARCCCWGSFEETTGTVEGNIGRHPKNRLQNYVWSGDDADKGKPAVTHYEVLEDLGYVSLLKCKLETGRTHQIRVHMKHIGHTLFNGYLNYFLKP